MVRAIMIVEMAGRPGAHVKEALEKHVNALDAFKDIELHSSTVSSPKKIEDSKKDGREALFTCFAEVDFETESFARLSETMFDFMPSSIEVIEPSELKMGAAEASDLLNNISGRMHRYDEVARMAQARISEMAAQMQGAPQVTMGKEEPKKKEKKKVSKKK